MVSYFELMYPLNNSPRTLATSNQPCIQLGHQMMAVEDFKAINLLFFLNYLMILLFSVFLVGFYSRNNYGFFSLFISIKLNDIYDLNFQIWHLGSYTTVTCWSIMYGMKNPNHGSTGVRGFLVNMHKKSFPRIFNL